MAITPYLLYEDVGAALEFLAKAFGFRQQGDVFRGPGGEINHAAMKLGRHLVMMGCPGKGYRNPRRLKQATVLLYVDVADADKHCARAEKAGAKIKDAPADTFYGARRYSVEDPEGHLWYFAAPLKRARTRATAKKRRRRP